MSVQEHSTDNGLVGDGTDIVVGVDGSESSKQALRWAAFLAASTGGGVLAISVWQPYPAYALAGSGWAPIPEQFNPHGDAEKLLTSTIDEVFGAQRPPALRTSVREGSVAKELIDASAHARMLVVGSRGHGGFVGLLLGSVSTACAEHSACPVVVIHGDSVPPAAS